jgi:hypothetical protein
MSAVTMLFWWLNKARNLRYKDKVCEEQEPLPHQLVYSVNFLLADLNRKFERAGISG